MSEPTFNNRENEHIRYEKDGEQKEAWLSRSVAVIPHVVMRKDHALHVLMVKRGPAAADNIGKWSLPCGYLDWNESGAEACMREIWEECRIDIARLMRAFQPPTLVHDDFSIDRPWLTMTNPNRDERQNVSLHYGLSFCVDDRSPLFHPEGDLTDEVEAVRWIRVDRLPLYDIAFGHDARVEQFVQLLAEH